MEITTIETIRNSKEGRLIGTIGARDPTPGYNAELSHNVGLWLREAVDQEGALFSGGVRGVGLDVYQGVVRRCCLFQRNGVYPSDNFFILTSIASHKHTDGYQAFTKHIEGQSEIYVIGEDEEALKKGVAELGDVLVMINGRQGTLDEAILALEANKRVLVIPKAGGAGKALISAAYGIDHNTARELAQQGFDLPGIQDRLSDIEIENNLIAVHDKIELYGSLRKA